MPDPHKTLAPIIEPAAPPAIVEAASAWPSMALTGLVLLVAAALAVWFWRRRAPLRTLRRIATQTDTAVAADQLAAWMRAHKIQPAPEWQSALDQLRFGSPRPDAAARLGSLCREIDRHRASPDFSRAGGNPDRVPNAANNHPTQPLDSRIRGNDDK
jgi:hypothetical protein